MLKEQLQKDKNIALKKGDKEKVNAIKYILGEIDRQNSKEVSDDKIIGIIKKSVQNELELVKSKNEKTSNFIEIMSVYLPEQTSEDEIKNWIFENINFSKYKNKMQAMKPIMQHFGKSVDGAAVRNILENI
jgi:hypothetical protein